MLPTVAIVGRPNVGKSSLLNKMIGRRISIVDPTPGVTRDRVTEVYRHPIQSFELVDTGGIGIIDNQNLSDHVEAQINFALNTADVIVFVVDVKDGVTPLDREVAEVLRSEHKNVVFCANKADTQKWENMTGEFWALGLGQPLPVSALEGINIKELVERIVEALPDKDFDSSAELEVMKLAIVGKRNAGKSTLVNTLAGSERMIVSEIPGTTRDAVDVRFEYKGQTFVAIDTAGLRRKTSVKESVEFYSQARSEKAIRRADVVLYLIDAAEPISTVDQKLVQFILDEYKPLILGVNKWDLAREAEKAPEEYNEYLSKVMPQVAFAPVAVLSGKENFNVLKVVDLALELFRQGQIRVPTAQLNQVLEKAAAEHLPRFQKVSQAPRLFYGTQFEVQPPTFMIFVNNPKLFGKEYQRYLSNYLRKRFEFKEIPLKLIFKSRRKVELEKAGEKE